MLNNLIKKNYYIYILIGLASILYSFVFFYKHQFIIASGESAAPFNNLTHLFHQSNSSWNTESLGYINVLVSNNTYYLLLHGMSMVIDQSILQIILFSMLIFLANIAIYKIVADLVSDVLLAKIFSILFYTFNLIVIVSVWGRLQYPFIIFYFTFPLLFYLFYTSFKNNWILNVIGINLLLVVFSLAYSSPPILILVAMIFGLYILFFFLSSKRKKPLIVTILRYFIVFFIVWVVFNIWWIIQLIISIFSTSYLSVDAYAVNDNLTTLVSLSGSLGNMSNIFRLMHGPFFNDTNNVFGAIYQTPLFIVLSYIIPVLSFFPLLIKKKNIHVYFFLGISLVTIFLMKGVGDPFGYLFYALFSNVRFFEGFRNPFEKFSLLLPFCLAPLLAYTIDYGFRHVNHSRYIKILGSLSLAVALFVVLVFPLWNKNVFNSSIHVVNGLEKGYYIQVPEYYESAREFLKKNLGTGRIIALPVSGEGMTYQWENGYSGVELTNNLLRVSAISMCTTIQHLCPIVNSISPTLIYYPEEMNRIMKFLDAKYVMVRHDVKEKERDLLTADSLEKIIREDTQLEKIQEFGELTFYTQPIEISEKIFPSNNGISFSSNSKTFISVLPIANKDSNIFFTDPHRLLLTNSFAAQSITHAEQIAQENISVQRETVLAILPHVSHLPGTAKYPLVQVKEFLEKESAGNNRDSVERTLYSKRLVESNLLIQNGKYQLAEQSFKKYLLYMYQITTNPEGVSSRVLKEELLRQKYLIEDNISLLNTKNVSSATYAKALKDIDTVLSKLGVITRYPVNPELYNSYRLEVPKSGRYSLIFESLQHQDFFGNEIRAVRVNGESRLIDIHPVHGFNQLLELDLEKGVHQVDILSPEIKKLNNTTEVSIDIKNGEKEVEIPVSVFNPQRTYKIMFSQNISVGNPPQVYVRERKNNGGVADTQLTFTVVKDDEGVPTLSAIYDPNDTVDDISLVVYAYASCPIHQTNCTDKSKHTKVYVENISVTANSLGELYAKSEINVPSTILPKITYKKMSATEYSVSVQNATDLYFLNFLESYHPLWKVYISSKNGSSPISESAHVLVNNFANSWLIDKKGDYELRVVFEPEKTFLLGKRVSFTAIALSIVLVILYSIFRRVKKKL